MTMKKGLLGERHSVQYGKERICFYLSFNKRSHLTISVNPDQRVMVKAPLGKSLDAVLTRVKKHAPWIIKQRDYFERFQPLQPEREYVSGETHYYLGRQYRLKVVKSDNNSTKLIGKYLWVHIPTNSSKSKIKNLVQGWYEEHGKAILENRLLACLKSARLVGIPIPKVKYRRMRKRWGSCDPSHTIALNIELVKAPFHCIDYVITHELCHLKHKNHSQVFYRLLSRLMPDWEKRKERLERVTL
jgi:predicted metal-dependent hydrolase